MDKNLERYRMIPIYKILQIKQPHRRITLRCPIHLGTGKTPSFNLYPDGGYKCYGCGAHGRNAIDFCRDLGFSFVDTLKELDNYLT